MDSSPDKKSRSRSRSRSTSKKSHSRSLSSSLSRSRSRSRSSEIDGHRLHIADIGDEVRKSDLERVFAPYGELQEVWMTNSTPCFGFAVYKNKKDASAALKGCDGVEVAGCRIRVTYARPRTRGSGRRYYSNNMRCYQCGYSGHFYRDCPEITGGSDRKDRYGRERRGYREQRGGGDRDRGGGDYGRRSSYRSSRRYSDDYAGGGGGRRRRSEGSGRRHRY